MVDPQAWKVDAFSIPWDNLFLYAFPPTVYPGTSKETSIVEELQDDPCRPMVASSSIVPIVEGSVFRGTQKSSTQTRSPQATLRRRNTQKVVYSSSKAEFRA